VGTVLVKCFFFSLSLHILNIHTDTIIIMWLTEFLLLEYVCQQVCNELSQLHSGSENTSSIIIIIKSCRFTSNQFSVKSFVEFPKILVNTRDAINLNDKKKGTFYCAVLSDLVFSWVSKDCRKKRGFPKVQRERLLWITAKNKRGKKYVRRNVVWLLVSYIYS